jgi:hypothetical protein
MGAVSWPLLCYPRSLLLLIIHNVAHISRGGSMQMQATALLAKAGQLRASGWVEVRTTQGSSGAWELEGSQVGKHESSSMKEQMRGKPCEAVPQFTPNRLVLMSPAEKEGRLLARWSSSCDASCG